MNEAYSQIIEILEKLANKTELPKGMVKKIYDLEREQVGVMNRNNQSELRRIIVESLESKEKLWSFYSENYQIGQFSVKIKL